MKSYNLKLDIERIMAILDITVDELANESGVSRITLIKILNGYDLFSIETVEKVYSYAYKMDINLNRSKELLYSDVSSSTKLLFHGAKATIEKEIDTHHSSAPNDFGDGFYTGESLSQAASWIAHREQGSVYCFYLKDLNKFKKKVFSTDLDWLHVVLFYRNAFKDFEPTQDILSLVKEVEESDIVIAPIADNEMFKIIDSFARNEITDEACMHAISASNLGTQYVFKNDKTCSKLEFVDRLYLCEKEKAHYQLEKDKLSNEGIEKAKLALIDYRRKGRYFDEIFKRKR